MKYFAVLSGLFFVFYLCGFIKTPKALQWMDWNFTTAIKGFAILTVVWSHSGARLGVGGIQFIAGIGVALFLICSGYGLEKSYERNGLKGFWKKRFLKICIPFWIVELFGQVLIGEFTIEKYVLTASFIKAGWYFQYILVCYLLFYVIKSVAVKHRLSQKLETILWLAVFAGWFALDSNCFANPDMPFLRARQMLSFPCGIVIAKNKESIESRSNKRSAATILVGGVIGLGFILVTNLPMVKALPYMASNVLSLLTVFPLAISVLIGFQIIPRIYKNGFLIATGSLSYELFLIHTFSLRIIRDGSIMSMVAFLVITYTTAFVLHFIVGGNDGRFNRCYINKK